MRSLTVIGMLGVLLVISGGLSELPAQNSILGTRGVGFPVRPLSVQARALGGAAATFDPLSAVNPAAPMLLGRVTVAAAMGSNFRSYEANAVAVDGIRETRFPLILLGGRLGSLPLAYAVSFGEYAERSFDVATSDTLMLSGEAIAVEDRIASDGGITDARGALAWQPADGVRLGAAVHVISGSAKIRVRRTFSDSTFRPYRQDNDAGFSAWGVSLGAIVTPVSGLDVGVTVRRDNDLDATLDSLPAGSVSLPMSVGGGLRLAPHPAIRILLGAEWRSWSDAAADVSAGTRAFDTWDLSGGFEIGGAATGTSRIPLRLGVRYARLPFAPAGARQPREIVLAAGTAFPFAGDRAVIDLSLERIFRDGTNVTERAWHLAVGMSVRP